MVSVLVLGLTIPPSCMASFLFFFFSPESPCYSGLDVVPDGDGFDFVWAE